MSPQCIHLAQHDDWQKLPDDQQSEGSDRSFRTVHHTSSPYHKSSHLHESSSSLRLLVRNENVPLGRDASQLSLPLASSPVNVLSHRRVSQPVSHKSSWGNGSLLTTRTQGVPSSLHDAWPLYDVDLNSISTNRPPKRDQSPTEDSEQALYDNLPVENKTGNAKPSTEPVSIVPGLWMRQPISPDQGTTAERLPTSAPNNLLKGENLIQRFRNTFSRRRKRSLTIRKERWTLDDFDERQQTKPNSLEQPSLNGHQKASSWAAFGFVNTSQGDTAIEGVHTAKMNFNRRSKSSFLRRKLGSKTSDLRDGNLRNSVQAPLRALELAAWTRAIQRREVLDELFISEKSYVADLKVLLHVSDTYSYRR